MQLGDEPNLYAFPETTGPNFVSRWNKFSPGYTIIYENNKFSEENPYGFKFNIKKDETTYDYSFSRDAQQGPSLDYLLSLTLAAKREQLLRGVELPSKCLNIGSKLPDDKENPPFLDIKRSGDGDQADGAKILNGALKSVILVTGDRLLSVQARLMNQHCILQYHQTLTIFKGDVPGMSDADRAKAAGEKEKRFVERYTAPYSIIRSAAFIQKVTGFIGLIQFPARLTKLVTTVRNLLGLKLEDMKNKLTKFLTGIRALPPIAAPAPDKKSIDDVIGILNSIDVPKSDIELFTKSFDTFDIKKDIPVLKYSFKPYIALSSAITVLNAKLTSTRTMRGQVNYFTLANQEGGYNSSLREILISMPPLADELVAQGVIPVPILDTMTTAERAGPVIARLNPKSMSGGSIQEGGELNAGQIMAKAFLLKEICSIASKYIRTTLAPHIPNTIKLSAFNNLKYSIGHKHDKAIQINLTAAKQYEEHITIQNVDTFIESVTPESDKETGAITDVFKNDDEIGRAINIIDEIKFIWETRYLETIGEEGLKASFVWNNLLDPFSEDSTLKAGHMYQVEGVTKAAAVTKRYDELPEIPALITLGIMNDIFEGSTARMTSVFTQLFLKSSIMPAKTKEYSFKELVKGDITNSWQKLEGLLTNIYRGISVGKIGLVSRVTLTLGSSGGSRTRMMKRRKRKGSPRRKTLRKTRKHR